MIASHASERLCIPHFNAGAAPALRSRRVVVAVAGSRASPLKQRQQQLRHLHGLPRALLNVGIQPQQQQQPCRSTCRRQVVAAAAAPAAAGPAAAAAAQTFWPALVQAWNTNPAAVMMAAGACILGVALSVFLLASIPAMLAMRRTALAMESLLTTVAAEVPDTAATLRLSGVELADCIQEMGALGTDLSEGVRASARAVASAEAGIRQGASLAGRTVTEYVIPQAQSKVEAALQERARLEYTREVLQQTKSATQRLRFALAASGLARGVVQSARYLRRPGGSKQRHQGLATSSSDELMGA